MVERDVSHTHVLWNYSSTSQNISSSSSTRCVPSAAEYVIGDSIPGIVNADEEQQEHSPTNAKQGLARVAESREGRHREYEVRCQREHDMKQANPRTLAGIRFVAERAAIRSA